MKSYLKFHLATTFDSPLPLYTDSNKSVFARKDNNELKYSKGLISYVPVLSLKVHS